MNRLVFDHLEQYGNQVALIAGDIVITYRQLLELSEKYLQEIPKRSVVLFVCENTNDIFQKQWDESEGQIVTLATCIGYEVTSERLVVNCMVVDERTAF